MLKLLRIQLARNSYNFMSLFCKNYYLECKLQLLLANYCYYIWLLQTPVHTIASNAGVEGAVVVGKLLEQDNPDLGYDAAKGPTLAQIFLTWL